MSQFVPYLAVAGRFAAISAIIVILYSAVKAVALLLTVIVGISTRDDKRREACVTIVDCLCKGGPRPPRLPRNARGPGPGS